MCVWTRNLRWKKPIMINSGIVRTMIKWNYHDLKTEISLELRNGWHTNVWEMAIVYMLHHNQSRLFSFRHAFSIHSAPQNLNNEQIQVYPLVSRSNNMLMKTPFIHVPLMQLDIGSPQLYNLISNIKMIMKLYNEVEHWLYHKSCIVYMHIILLYIHIILLYKSRLYCIHLRLVGGAQTNTETHTPSSLREHIFHMKADSVSFHAAHMYIFWNTMCTRHSSLCM